MTIIKLTYSHPHDKFRTVTVLGDPNGIFDLYGRLTAAPFEYPSHGVGQIRLTNLDGHPIDPTKGRDEVLCVSTELSRNVG